MIWKSGTEVEVFDENYNFLGKGVLLKDYDKEEPLSYDMPEIELKDGEVIKGCDCWWIPTQEAKNYKEFTVNLDVRGYNLSLDITVLAKNEEDAKEIACSHEFRYQDDDPYCLLVEDSVLCTYQDLEEGLKHIKTIIKGNWLLVESKTGNILKQSF